jgi:carboxypeptidase family protein
MRGGGEAVRDAGEEGEKGVIWRGLILLAVIPIAFSGLMGQERIASGPYKGFLQERPALKTVEIAEAFTVSALEGAVLFGANGESLAGAAFEIRDRQGHVRTAITNNKGQFQIRDVRRGQYDFKITKDQFQSVVGKVIVVSRYSFRKRRPIRVVLQLGT